MSSVLLSAVLCSVIASPPAPVWADQFSVPINQTIKITDVGTFNNTFWYYYDAINNVSRTDHGKGQMDELCRSIKGKKNSDEPCTMIVAKDGWRYIQFPEESSCCKYCNVSSGCGIIKKDWLKGAAYQGQKTIQGRLCNGWMQQGGEKNYYYATADAAQDPCEYYEGYPTFLNGINIWMYSTTQYKTGPQDPKLFEVPSTCTSMCDIQHL
eukprot:TRINITY_DN12537_c0_g1_i1.p1 TRINITY_DN12537_c0_g1~~TRINITY_DN12537_c0_g1_i1.p1  ORF type:complete len:210 (+),score=42.69 TRINITY_DN12537_c0_g1_i1:58-687(+)